jgi:hypothetical protein
MEAVALPASVNQTQKTKKERKTCGQACRAHPRAVIAVATASYSPVHVGMGPPDVGSDLPQPDL